MARWDYSRRDFLKTFAGMSSASLLLGLSSGCGRNDIVNAAYGPPPVTGPVVTGIYYDVQPAPVSLYNRQNVPIDAAFLIECSADMNTAAAPPTVHLNDANRNGVALTSAWDNSRSLRVTPDSTLSPGMDYIMIMGSDAYDLQGKMIQLTPDATAAFKTA